MKPSIPAFINDGAAIISGAQELGLSPTLLYEAVIELTADGLLTANCINLAAGILIKDLGLPPYFFAHIQKDSLVQLLQSIALNLRVIDDRAQLYGRVATIDFNLNHGTAHQRVRIATEETRDSMETILEELLLGHRREYYYCPESSYYTYIIRPETVHDFPVETFEDSPFLFSLAGDYSATPEPTRKRYEKFLKQCESSTLPLIEVFNLPETGETRLMFKSDYESSQLPILRKILKDRGYTLTRAYWEPYLTRTDVPSSICALYIKEELTRGDEKIVLRDLQDFLAFSLGPIKELYLKGELSLQEMLFGGNGIDFTHLFIFKESENETDREILKHLVDQDHQDAFAKRVQDSNKSTYSLNIIAQTVAQHPDLIKELYALFEVRFDPGVKTRYSNEELEEARLSFDKKINSRFIDFPIGIDIFRFMFKLVSCTLKTNFYCSQKRSYSFRFDRRVLDPLVFPQFVYGVFFVNGHYSCGTHLRAGDIARGGLRLLRVSRSNHDIELDNTVLLNYALGPKAQRIKHKDICESGSKGVVVPHPAYAAHPMDCLHDYTEGIMDLILMEHGEVVDYYGQHEMVFFGPDEGTAQLMDAVALRAQERGYPHWRTVTTGKSFGIPHDTYGMLHSGESFGLFSLGADGVELQVDGERRMITDDMEGIYSEIGEEIAVSGMTTGSVMATFRSLISHYGEKEEDLNLMITGGPDGDLGANQIQCYRGKICLIIDGGSVLFDPEGLDKKELRKLAFKRNSEPRLNSLDYPVAKLSPQGFMVPRSTRNITLPDGTLVEDGGLFHKTFLSDQAFRTFLKQARIRAFIPCGGFKDTINQTNVSAFLKNFRELQFIVEGANVFFDEGARRYIATHTEIKQIKDSTANKGGVFSSSISEVLTGFLLEEEYDEKLLSDRTTRWALIRDIMMLVEQLAQQETEMLLKIKRQQPEVPLFSLSEHSSEAIFELQEQLSSLLPKILEDTVLVEKVLLEYIPASLVSALGIQQICLLLNSSVLSSYRNSIITKKLAAMAFYRFGDNWDQFLSRFQENSPAIFHALFKDNK